MRLTRRDGFTTLVMAACTAVLLAVTQGWDWPLLGSYRTGTLALGILGQAMCAGGARDVMSLKKNGGYIAAMSVLGGGALVLVVVGLITSSEPVFVALWAVILGMWIVSTVRHAVQPTTAATPAAAHR
jgi:peptidoglycan/LPS O-acetylase OafA/YrhL